LKFSDDYRTCSYTYATLRVYPPDGITPEGITERLGIEPHQVLHKGHCRPSGLVQRVDAWLFGSEGKVVSKDSRRHIHWLLDQLEPCREALRQLANDGVSIDIVVRWDSSQGHGGPIHDQALSRRLADFEFDLWYDVYVGWDVADEVDAH